MKSTADQLRNRGYASDELNKSFVNKSFVELIELLKSPVAVERTLAARFLHRADKRSIDYLCEALQVEKKLYTKIELSNSIVSYGESAVSMLIDLLGKIGSNQHLIIAKEEFKKSSYPLPRDIASRTLIRIGKSALPALIDILTTGTDMQKSEGIDAIGYICFYDNHDIYLLSLIHCYTKTNSDLIKWKIIRAMSAFSESLYFLEQEIDRTANQEIKNEIGRVIKILKNKNSKS